MTISTLHLAYPAENTKAKEIKGSMNVTDAMFHLDAAARSVPEPTFPPDVLNSTVADILRATRPFLDTDRDWIFSNIEGLQQQVSVYDTLLNRIDEIRSEVQSHRDAVYKSMESHSSILAPIRRLPIDVLKSVFREMQILQWQDRSPEGLDLSQGPWTLSHVCGVWRHTVLSYPKLWSHITLNFNFGYSELMGGFAHRSATRHVLAALDVIILHSAQCPLDIGLSRGVGGRGLDIGITNEAFSMILDMSHRWRTLTLCGCISLDFFEWLKMIRGRIPCLESLNLSPLGRVPEGIRIIFDDAPCLRKVTTTWNLKNLVLPPQITHLAAKVESVSNLEIYQYLVECHLDLPSNFRFNPDAPPIVLPNVRCLFVSSLQVLAHLCLPSLNDLTIISDTSTSHQPVQVVDDFLHRSRCSLTRLASPCWGNEILAYDSLLSMDTLVSLEVGLDWNDNMIIDVLASDRFLPSLQHLQLSGPMMPESQHFLSAVLACHGRHLRSVKFYCSTPADVEIMDQQLALMQGPGQRFIAVLEGRDHGRWRFRESSI